MDIRGNAVKNIGSNVNQRVTGLSLKDDSVSSLKPRSQKVSRRLELPCFSSMTSCAWEGHKTSFRTTVSS